MNVKGTSLVEDGADLNTVLDGSVEPKVVGSSAVRTVWVSRKEINRLIYWLENMPHMI